MLSHRLVRMALEVHLTLATHIALAPDAPSVSQPATASDSIYARILAQNAVHGAMAGFTDFCACQANNRMVYMPLGLVARHSPRKMNRGGRTMERVYGSTGQPDTRGLPTRPKPAEAEA